ncbi:MAG: type II secretion system protein [Candidatus Nomurabacteria bacterium]|nr:type II secretion system protein [Candidatus Nomurabacteria bacterium]
MKNIFIPKNRKSGFTLLELLIVIAILAILSVALVIVLNPAETLKKSRDAQRMSDLSTMKTAIGLYLTSTTSPTLGSSGANSTCKLVPSTAWGAAGTYKIWYSLPSSSAITDVSLDASTVTTPAVQVATPSLADGTGWIPINFTALTGGSPISNLPVDPTNTISTLSAVASTDLVYRYACSQTPLAYEIDAQLESSAYSGSLTTDGGNSTAYYETGTNLSILGMGSNNTDY